MKKLIDKNILNPYIEYVINRCSFLYGLDRKLLTDRMNEINKLYISNEIKDTWFMCFDSSDKSISINPKYVNYDSLRNRLVLDDKTKSAVVSVFIHELVHAASTRRDAVGIRYFSDIDRLGLNEGLTQMITDDVTDNMESKYFDGYYELKNVAKILRTTFGTNTIIDSFFLGSKGLENGINRLSGKSNYYDILSKKMNALESLKDIRRKEGISKIVKRQCEEYYNKTAYLLYKDIILNLVMPKLNSLNADNKKKYLKNVISSVSGDTKTKNEIVAILTSLQGKNDLELEREKNKLEKENNNMATTGEFINLVESGQDFLNRFMIRRDGSVIMLGNPNRLLESEMARETIYSAMFDVKYGKAMTPAYLDTIYKQIINGKPINIKGKDKAERLIIFTGFRRYLCSKKRINILNDPREFNDKESIKNIVYINTDEDYLTFDEAHRICRKFGIYRVDKDHNDMNIDVIDKDTGIKVEDPYIKSVAYFANNWMLALGKTNSNNDEVDKAFEKYYRVVFDDVMKALYKDYNDQGNKERVFPSAYCRYPASKKIVEKFLATPEKYEQVFDYFKHMGSSNNYQVFKGKSFKELKDSNYLDRQAELAASRIVR